MDWLPPQASTFAGEIDFMFWVDMAITGIAFVLVQVTLIWFLIRYRGRPGGRGHYTHGNKTAEIIWTTIPAVTMVVLGIWSNRVWAEIKDRDSMPTNAFEVALTASQFEWNVTYPGPDGTLGNADDFTVRNQLHVPVDRPVLIQLSAEDVIHSFFVPEFRIKQDAVPGMIIPVWFQATEVGEFEIGCAELCGLGHYRMRGIVTVHAGDDVDLWMSAHVAGGESGE